MRHVVLWGSVALAIGAALACSSSSSEPTEEPPIDPAAAEAGTPASLPPTGVTPQGPAGTGALTGLPCDVQAVLEDRCLACHSGKIAVALLTYDDLVAKSKVDPTKTLAQIALDRMKSKTSPMPPPPAEPPDADEIKTFEDWVAAGTPKGAVCTDPPPAAPDGGTATDGGADGGTASKCTSGKTWAGGNTASPLMHPGAACNACHQVMGGPNLRIAGTVYSTLHEPNDCDGKGPPPALTVVITDKTGKVTNLPVNAAGNFFTRAKVLAPYKAKVTDGTKTRAMTGSVTAGDCNSCHTDPGANGAPGRVMAP